MSTRRSSPSAVVETAQLVYTLARRSLLSSAVTAHMQDRRRPHLRRATRESRPSSGGGASGAGPGRVHIFGVHAVEAVLGNARRTVHRLYLTDNAEHRLQAALAARQLPHERVLPKDLDRRLGADTVHQGAMAEVD